MAWPRRPQPPHDLLRLLHEARREPLRRLVHQDQLGIGHERAADSQHLLLAAAEQAAGMINSLGELGKLLQHLVEVPALSRLPPFDARADRASTLVGISRFSRTLSERKIRRPCGTIAMPACAMA